MLARILLAIAGFALLQNSSFAQSFGGWTVELKGRDYIYAATVKNSGHIFGQYCYSDSGNCIWMLGIRTRCREGAKYPVLANADTGAAQLQIYCFGSLDTGEYVYAFTDFEDIDRIARSGQRVGFAIPLEEDKFRVVRFDLLGATSALNVMRAAASRRTTPAGRGTRDVIY